MIQKDVEMNEFENGMRYVFWLLEKAYKESSDSTEFSNKVLKIIRENQDGD